MAHLSAVTGSSDVDICLPEDWRHRLLWCDRAARSTCRHARWPPGRAASRPSSGPLRRTLSVL